MADCLYEECKKALKRALTPLLCASIFLIIVYPGFARASGNGRTIAFIDQVIPEGARLSDVARIRRNGSDVGISANSISILAGDQIYMRRDDAVLVIRMLATNSMVLVRKLAPNSDTKAADWTAPTPPVEGLPVRWAGWFFAALKGADNSGGGSALAASRNGQGSCYNDTGKTNEPTTFQIPILRAQRSLLVAGARSLYVSWRGGSPPFTVTLSAADGTTVIARRDRILDACAAYLQPTNLTPGRYRLSVLDANNVKEQEDDLFVTKDQPPSSLELKQAQLTDEARAIYMATWLTTVDGGEWGFEAEQRVASLRCKSAAAQEWLRQWGGTLRCEGL
jgi:hypothetical protein